MQSGQAELDFVILGAQKSASTFVHHCLLEHPQIDIPSEESRTFEDPFYSSGALAELDRLFGPRSVEVRRGIKRPDYLADPAVPERLARAAPDLRLLAVLRDPVPRAVSAYFHYVRLGFLPVQPLDRGFEQILDGTLERTYPRAADVLRYGLYGEHLTRYLEHFGRDQLLVLMQRDLRTQPAEEIASVLRFLEVRDDLAAELVSATPPANSGSYDQRRVRLQRSRNRFLFDYTPDRYRRTPKPKVSRGGFLLAGGATVLDQQVLARFDRAPAPKLSPALEQRLRDLYAADAEVLQSLLGRQVWD